MSEGTKKAIAIFLVFCTVSALVPRTSGEATALIFVTFLVAALESAMNK